MQAYKEEILTKNQGKANMQFVKVISLPTFELSHSIVLLDLESLQSYEVGFDLSEGISYKNKMKLAAKIETESPTYEVDM